MRIFTNENLRVYKLFTMDGKKVFVTLTARIVLVEVTFKRGVTSLLTHSSEVLMCCLARAISAARPPPLESCRRG